MSASDEPFGDPWGGPDSEGNEPTIPRDDPAGAVSERTDEGALHDWLMAQRPVRALCAAVDLAIMRGHLDARSVIGDARLVVGDPDATDEPELLRRIAITRPGEERECIEREHGRDDFRPVGFVSADRWAAALELADAVEKWDADLSSYCDGEERDQTRESLARVRSLDKEGHGG